VGSFYSTGGQGGGQESTAIALLPFFAHHGMIYVPLGPNKLLSNNTEIHGGSAFGAGTVTGSDGSRQPSELELEVIIALFKKNSNYCS
jgi:NAD(P)H dehydrogenase (quinone)